MSYIFRSIQTWFPFLHDLRYLVSALKIRLSGQPVEEDFKALSLFNPKPNEVFVDIGANRGLTLLSVLIQKKFKNRIIGFEPNPLVFSKIFKNPLIRNKRITLHNVGLGNEEGELTLYVPFYRRWMFDGLSSFNYEDAKNWLKNRLWGFKESNLTIKKVTCAVKRLDHYELNPYFIKIDVQGFEWQVLQGGLKTLKKHRPILLVESPDDKVSELLADLDYKPYRYESGQLQAGEGQMNTFFITDSRMKNLS